MDQKLIFLPELYLVYLRKINTVKKILILIWASLTVLSCRKDDDEVLSNSLYGNWKMVNISIYSGKDNSVLSSENIPEGSCKSKNKYAFTEDQFSITYYETKNNQCEISDTASGEFSYNKSTKQLRLKNHFNFTYIYSDYTVEYLTNKELHLANEYYDVDENHNAVKNRSVVTLKRY